MSQSRILSLYDYELSTILCVSGGSEDMSALVNEHAVAALLREYHPELSEDQQVHERLQIVEEVEMAVFDRIRHSEGNAHISVYAKVHHSAEYHRFPKRT